MISEELQERDYYDVVLLAIRLAQCLGYVVGTPEVHGADTTRVYLLLPTGQIYWDVPNKYLTDRWPRFLRKDDGHGVREQRKRIGRYVAREDW